MIRKRINRIITIITRYKVIRSGSILSARNATEITKERIPPITITINKIYPISPIEIMEIEGKMIIIPNNTPAIIVRSKPMIIKIKNRI